jgi:TRAP-type C4-dicarboxylate transport system permease small subunit
MALAPAEGDRWNRGLALFTFLVSGLLLLTISVMVTADVFGRYVLLSPIPGTLEIERMMMPYVCFCAFAYAFVTDSHVRVTLVTSRLGYGVRRINAMVAGLIGSAGCAIISYGAWLFFLESLRVKEVLSSGADFWIPLWLGKFGFPIGFSLFTLALLRGFWRLVRKKGEWTRSL